MTSFATGGAISIPDTQEMIVAYAEKRSNMWQIRWRSPDGILHSKPGFGSRKDAENYGRDQEAAIRAHTYVDPRASRITLTDWVNSWFPALDLEPSTMANYRYYIQIMLPRSATGPWRRSQPREVSAWERQITASGYAPSTARDAIKLITVLGDAIPQHLQFNPAQRRKGRGRVVAAHRAAREGREGMARSAAGAARRRAVRGAVGLRDRLRHDPHDRLYRHAVERGVGLKPECVRGDQVSIQWSCTSWGQVLRRLRPKDGSIRPADLPPFLSELLAAHLRATDSNKCTCTGLDAPWCEGEWYAFLGPKGGHFRRSAYGARFFR